jgi:hypothetical protein
MDQPIDKAYYTARQLELAQAFDEEAQRWRPFIVSQFGGDWAAVVLRQARAEFETLLPQIPYIGGDQNHLTNSLIESVRDLALYKAMKRNGKTAADTGKILYDAILSRAHETAMSIAISQTLTPAELMERRKRRAERSQARRYPEDYVYEFVAGDGESFDYGYVFIECAAQKFYHAQNADEFTPFYCFLDYPSSKIWGQGLTRTMTLAEGHAQCDPRFKKGRKTELEWPPPFMETKRT